MDTIANNELDLECIASKILSAILYPDDYINLRSNICNLYIIDWDSSLSEIYPQIVKMVRDKQGYLKDKEIESFYYGKNEELLSVLQKLHTAVITAIPESHLSLEYHVTQSVAELDVNMQGQDFAGMADAINASQQTNLWAKELDENNKRLQIQEGLLNHIINAYGSAKAKLPKKSKEISLSPEYQIFLNSITQNIGEITSNTLLAVIIGKVVDSISASLPSKTNLDPFNNEIALNVLHSLADPENFYKECKMGNIVSSAVGTLFGHCYPEFFHKFVDIYMEDLPKMSYQEQINFRKCFGLSEDNSQLIQLCSTYVAMNFNAQGA